MKPIRNMFNEVRYELVKIILLNVFLSTVILFLVADLVALMFGMPIWYVIAVSFVYFAVLLVYEVRKISIAKVEEKNPELREILRTANDNQSEENLMAHALFHEVMEKMRKVSSGTFIDFRSLMTKLGMIFGLAILLVGLTYFNVNIQQFNNPFEKPVNAIRGVFSGTIGQAEGDSDVQDAADDVFGEYRMAELGDDELVATVNPSLNNPDFGDVGEADPSDDPLADLGGEGEGFNQGGSGFTRGGLDERDLERSYKYAKETQK